MIPEIARAGLIDLDITVFFQLGLFLLLLFILNKLAFSPLLALFAERRNRSIGAKKEAAEALERVRNMEESLIHSMADSTRKGAEIRNRLKEEAMAREAETLGKVRSDAAEQLKKERARLEAMSKDARPALEAEAAAMAGELMKKLKVKV